MPVFATTLKLRRTIFAVVVFALALAQTLGVMHRVVHSPLTAAAAAASRSSASSLPTSSAAATGADAGRHGAWLKALFAGHSSEQGCDLYDQLSHSDLIHVDVAAAVLPQPVAPPAALHRAWHLAAAAAGFLARGPPLAG